MLDFCGFFPWMPSRHRTWQAYEGLSCESHLKIKTKGVFQLWKTQVPQQAKKKEVWCIPKKLVFKGKRRKKTYTPKEPSRCLWGDPVRAALVYRFWALLIVGPEGMFSGGGGEGVYFWSPPQQEFFIRSPPLLYAPPFPGFSCKFPQFAWVLPEIFRANPMPGGQAARGQDTDQTATKQKKKEVWAAPEKCTPGPWESAADWPWLIRRKLPRKIQQAETRWESISKSQDNSAFWRWPFAGDMLQNPASWDEIRWENDSILKNQHLEMAFTGKILENPAFLRWSFLEKPLHP